MKYKTRLDMKLEKDILQKLKEYWPDKWEKLIDHFTLLEERFKETNNDTY